MTTTTRKTAVHAMRDELADIGAAMASCCSEDGVVWPEHRYRYQELVRMAKVYHDAIGWMESQNERKG